jgi:beta-lactamase superfamily II metal-dependent hydrolase
MVRRPTAVRRAGAPPNPQDAAASNVGVSRLAPKTGEAIVRFYRIGHGDCFLLAFPRKDNQRPVFVLIDCGFKPNSPEKIIPQLDNRPERVVANIKEVTGGRIDVAVITHEHQDHVNGIKEDGFEGFEFGEVWLAWTEDPTDEIANGLRARLNDQLLAVVSAKRHFSALAGVSAKASAGRLSDLLELELGLSSADIDEVAKDAHEPFTAEDRTTRLGLEAAAHAIRKKTGDKTDDASGGKRVSSNKKSMEVWKSRAKRIRYIRPHQEILTIPEAGDLRIYALGPPRGETAAKAYATLKDLDPDAGKGEDFHFGGQSERSYARFLGAALNPEGGKEKRRDDLPFDQAFGLPIDEAAKLPKGFFATNYFGVRPPPKMGDNASDWRRIDGDWLMSAEALAIAMNNSTNNTSLVLAFELGLGKQVMLFAGDAQRGNWVSWADGGWTERDGGRPRRIEVRELLSRTVLYKAGHHGSHNATLNGLADDNHPNLAWLGSSEEVQDFTALITAVEPWARADPPDWDHPQPAIKRALLARTQGRVLQTDTPLKSMRDAFRTKHQFEMSPTVFQKFERRVFEDPSGLYFDLTIKAQGR